MENQNKLAIQKRDKAASMITMAAEKQVEVLKALGINVAAFERVAMNALLSNPDIANCTPASIYTACCKAAQTGLLPDGKQAAIVPRKETANFEPMVGGLTMLVREANPGISVNACAAFDGEEFEESRGTEQYIKHKPYPQAKRTWENLLAVYAVVFHKGNPVPEFEVMYKEEIQEFRDRSPSKRGPWSTWSIEMAKVRPLKRLAKRLTGRSDRLMQALEEEDERQPEKAGQPSDPEAGYPGFEQRPKNKVVDVKPEQPEPQSEAHSQSPPESEGKREWPDAF